MAEERKELPPGVPADFNMADEMVLNQFIDDNAFGAFVDSIGEAFVDELSSEAGSANLLATVMAEQMSDPATKADFTVDLMQKDEMLLLGLLGDNFEQLAK